MVVVIILLSVILTAALAYIFYQSKVLKNTRNIAYEIADKAGELAKFKSTNMELAYDGKYYPATVISKMVFNAVADMTLTDFSMYDKYKIVGFTVYTTDKLEDCYMPDEAQDWDEEIKEELRQSLLEPTLYKNCIVYAPREGWWRWKLVQ